MVDAADARGHRQSIRFAAAFAGWILLFALVSHLEPVNRALLNPYTEHLARAAGALLRVLGEEVHVRGTMLASARRPPGAEMPFTVNIYKGCNGVLASSIYLAAVLAFPAGWRARGIGAALGLPAIQLINMARILSLYYIGVFWPRLFRAAHGYVWQSIVIFLSMAVWIYWAERFARLPPPSAV